MGSDPSVERRSHPRLPLRCPLALYRPGVGRPIQGETLNISSNGLYCRVEALFAPGESLSGVLSAPTEDAPYRFEGMKLKCDLEVVRVETVGGKAGIGCRVRNFSVLTEDLTG